MENPAGPPLSKGRVNRGSELGTTPNDSCARVSGVLPFIGRFSICRLPITWPTDAVAVESSVASAVTVTASVWLPTSSTTSCVTRVLVPIWICSCTYRLNPAASTVILYGPGDRKGNVYSPDSLVVPSDLEPVSFWTTITLIPGMDAPLGSETRPERVDRNSCDIPAKTHNPKTVHTRSALLNI